MTVYLVISLPKIPYMHRICMVLANPTHVQVLQLCVLYRCMSRKLVRVRVHVCVGA